MIALLSALAAIPGTWPATVARVTAVLATAGVVALLLHRSSAAFRHLVWVLGLTSCAVLAVAAPAVPRIDIPVRALAHARRLMPAAEAYNPRAPRAHPIVVARPRAITIGGREMDIIVPVVAAAAPRHPPLGESLPLFFALTWVAGFLFVIGRARLGHSRVASIVDDAQRLTSNGWRAAIESASVDVGITRAADVLVSDEITSPMTSGFLNPVVILPAEARAWDAERRHIVLVHELAHVARFDYLAQLVATFVCAIFWFHPLAWIAAARLRAEAEHAADDHVLNAGTPGVAYATHLLELARQHSGGLASAAAVGMLRSSRLEGRFRAMLDSHRSRTPVSSRLQAVATSVTLCAMIPLAGLRLVPARPSAATLAAVAPRLHQILSAARSANEAIEAAEPVIVRQRGAERAMAISLAMSGDSVFEKTIDASAGDRLTLDLRTGGELVIHGWDEPRVRVVGRLGGRDWRDTRVSLERTPDGLRLRSDFESARENSSTSHEFELWVPRHTNIRLSSAGGSLAINDLSGDFYGHTGGGGITIRDAAGSASLSTGGGAISIANSHLSGSVSTGGGELTVTNVTGGLRGGSGTGAAIVSNADGASTVRAGVGYGMNTGVGFGEPATISTNRVGRATTVIGGSVGAGISRGIATSVGGALAISKDGGPIVIDRAPDGAVLITGGGRIVVGSSGGGLTANTGGGDIELDNVGGDASASTGAGDVRISVVNSIRSDHTIAVESGKGRVVIEVPASLDARIELESAYTDNFGRRTNIASDFALQQSETDQWDSSAGTPRKYVRASGVIGSGRGLIRVRTVNGDVVLKRVSR